MSIETFTESILSKIPVIGKWQGKFFVCLIVLWVRLCERCNFENMAHQGNLNAWTYRKNFAKTFDFVQFNKHLYVYLVEEQVMVFDPCFILKSGKDTEGLGRFWSGGAGKVKKVWKSGTT